MRRRLLMAVVVAAFALAGCGEAAPAPTSADYPWYESVAELYQRADLVVLAEIGDGATRELVMDGDAFTHVVFPARVTEVFKGTAATEQVVEVKQLPDGDGVHYEGSEELMLDAGTSYLLFLETYPDVPASLLNPEQGQYVVAEAGEPVAVGHNDIELSVTELRQFAAGGETP